jgi:hypothetical protein
MKEFNKPIFCKNCKLGHALIMEEDEYDYSEFICNACNQPERSKREDLIEMIVPPEPNKLTKKRLKQDLEFVKNCCGVNPDLLGCGALNSMET